MAYRAQTFVTRDEWDAWRQVMENRLSVIEHALVGALEQQDDLVEALESAFAEPEEESVDGGPDDLAMGYGSDERDYAEEPEADYSKEYDETPEEEANRLRREAADAFEAGNESPEAVETDVNDIADVPEEGITLAPGHIRDFAEEPDDRN